MDEIQIEQYLKINGWYLGRKVDISKMEEWYQSEGYEIFDTARSFLEEYGYLNLYLTDNARQNKKLSRSIVIDPEIAAEELWVVENYNKYFDTYMLPIAECQCYADLILIGKDGNFYATSGNYAVLIGNSFSKVLEYYLFFDSHNTILHKISF